MRDVDLATWRFDFDLTLAMLIANADGTVYHRYGTRDHTDPMSWMSMPTLVNLLRDALPTHEAYAKDPHPPAAAGAAPRTIAQSPSFAREDAKKPRDCVHCHMVNEFERKDLREAKRWSMEDIWLQPPPARIGLTLDPADQRLVTAVAKGSPAAKAGLRDGDRLVRAGTQRLLTIADLQWVLDELPRDAATLELVFARGDEPEKTAKVRLKDGWKRGDPLDLAWRSSKWGLRPAPGYGGPALDGDELVKLGLDRDDFAFRVQYLVTWGDEAKVGNAVAKAGLRKGDVIIAAAGKRDFESQDHFQSWFRLTQRAGTTYEVEVIRDGKRTKLTLPVVE